MKKIRYAITATTILLQFHCANASFLSFLDLKTPATPTKQAIPENQIARLNKAVDLIQRYYIKKVDEKVLMDNAISGMITKLDPHSSYLSQKEMKELETTVSGEFVGIGVELTTDHGLLRVISPIAGTPADKAGLKPGDLIIKVNDKLIQDMSVSEAIDQIKGKPNTTVVLTVLRKDDQKPSVLKIMREVVHVQAVQPKLLIPGYAYIRLTFFQGPVVTQIRDAIEKFKSQSGGHLKGLVLDLRNNPGGLLDVSADILDLFLDKNTTARYHNLAVYTKGRIPNSDNSFYVHDNDIIPHVPMIVLINGGSASASEIVAGALQDYKRAIIMGTRSFGKGSVQTVIPIGNDNAIKLTTALYYTPAGREIQAYGIEPDVIVPELTVNGEKQNSAALLYDEANYGNHIVNNNDGAKKSDALTQKEIQTSNQKAEIALAKEDYQLYEALMMLKGAHAMR